MTAVSDRDKLAYVNAQAADGRVNLEFETDDGMTLNMGPQHPATHGTLRIIARPTVGSPRFTVAIPPYTAVAASRSKTEALLRIARYRP